jgi:hypothetical protein
MKGKRYNMITMSYFLAGVIGAATVAAGACFGFVIAALLFPSRSVEHEGKDWEGN